MNTIGCYVGAKLCKVMDRGLKYYNFVFFVFFFLICIYLAAMGLSCSIELGFRD